MSEHPWDSLGPDYDPESWKLGYQSRQFGAFPDPQGFPGGAYSALANPPESMTIAAGLPFPPEPEPE